MDVQKQWRDMWSRAALRPSLRQNIPSGECVRSLLLRVLSLCTQAADRDVRDEERRGVGPGAGDEEGTAALEGQDAGTNRVARIQHTLPIGAMPCTYVQLAIYFLLPEPRGTLVKAETSGPRAVHFELVRVALALHSIPRSILDHHDGRP